MSTSPEARAAARTEDATPAAPPAWYGNAVIYQLHVKSFCDSDGDGIGDLRGLTSRLDYLQDLGVTALWLLPFYPSPLRDDGYDIADYTGVHPSYGTLRDFKRFVQEAHRRNLRVITELVINHTSDQHPWFRRARAAPPGSKERDFYVWSDDDERYDNVRIIFQDFERSNWTWDEEAQAYFWHRFYHHQPDLNFDNPEVHRALLKVLDFWLGLGVDGLRLDAVPYLYEREGTNCENLDETHGFLRKLRRHVDARYRDRMLLGEANMWPEDAVQYFGDGDECHMAFHFPLMPRLFVSVQQEDRFPLVDILQQTPSIPAGCQWAVFLRNHDELTLEMVTDEERDYMYRTYAAEPRARINLGIRRRLAPLIENNRRKIELMNALLFSLPGSPIVYYGDEIGMGDNIYLGDRDGVRTPMQWSPDRNAGFSRANPQQLYLPVVIDPEYSYESVNVEAEQQNPHSLLWWMRRLIATRRRYPVFGRGGIEFLHPDNPKVLAFLRSDDEMTVLVVANLSRFVQSAELDLSEYRGRVPVETFGRRRFPPIGELPYFLTLGPHDFYWFEIESPAGVPEADDASLPELGPLRRFSELFDRERCVALEDALPRWMTRRRWFGGKARTIQSVRVAETIPFSLPTSRREARIAFVEVQYVEGEPDTYLVPLALATGPLRDRILGDSRQAVVAQASGVEDAEDAVLYDASVDDEFWTAVMRTIARRRRPRGARGEASGWFTVRTREAFDEDGAPLRPTLSRVEQTNTSAIFGDRWILKLFRRVQPGQNPDEEIGRFLTERARFPHTPPVAGGLRWARGKEAPWSLALLQRFVVNHGDAWTHFLNDLAGAFEEVSAAYAEEGDRGSGEGQVEAFLPPSALLGRRTAELHLALASAHDDPAFTPEPFAAPHYQRSLYQSVRNLLRRSFDLLRGRVSALPEGDRETARRVLEREAAAGRTLEVLRTVRFGGQRCRVHGDYHLGQVLHTGRDFVIIDFEGEPARSIGERRLKRSPLRDVAGMLRSFDYAARVGLSQHLERWGLEANDERRSYLRTFADRWRRGVQRAFLEAYREGMRDARVLPPDERQVDDLLRVFLLDKASYELSYELNNRPDWVRIPLDGILRLTEDGHQGGDSS